MKFTFTKSSNFNSYIFSFESLIIDSDKFNLIINTFFSKLLNNRKYFLLLRVEFTDNKIASLHKGIVVSKSLNKKYFNYINDILSLKSNDYTSVTVDKIFFDFFLIDKEKEQYYTNKWSELKPLKPKLQKFSNSTITNFIPLNRNYRTWGNILLENNNEFTVLSHNVVYKISEGFTQEAAEPETIIEIYKNSDLFLRFIDLPYYLS